MSKTDALLAKLLPKAPKTFDDLRDTANEAAQADYDLTIAKEARDKELAEVAERHGAAIITLEKRLAKLRDTIKTWALGHRDQFAGKQTLPIDAHLLAFQKSPGAYGSAHKDAEIIEAILGSEDDALIEAGIVAKPSLDKKAIKAHIEAGDELGQRFEQLGCQVLKPETFDFRPGRLAD